MSKSTKFKPCKGVLKRARITGKGKVKFKHMGKSHLNSKLSGRKSQDKGKPGYVKKGDIKRMNRVLGGRFTATDVGPATTPPQKEEAAKE